MVVSVLSWYHWGDAVWWERNWTARRLRSSNGSQSSMVPKKKCHLETGACRFYCFIINPIKLNSLCIDFSTSVDESSLMLNDDENEGGGGSGGRTDDEDIANVFAGSDVIVADGHQRPRRRLLNFKPKIPGNNI